MAFRQGAYPLIENGTATGAVVEWPGGRGTFAVFLGTFSGATVKLQWSPDDGTTWLDVDASGDTFVTKTAVGAGNFELPICKIRAAVTGGPPSGVHAWALST